MITVVLVASLVFLIVAPIVILFVVDAARQKKEEMVDYSSWGDSWAYHPEPVQPKTPELTVDQKKEIKFICDTLEDVVDELASEFNDPRVLRIAFRRIRKHIKQYEAVN